MNRIAEINPWITQGVLFALFVFILYVGYRFLRKHVPFLGGNKEVNSLIQQGNFAKAGEQLLLLGREDQAIETFLQGGLYNEAADVYASQRNISKALPLYEKGLNFKKVAELHMKQGNLQRLEDFFSKHRRLAELGELYAQNKKHEPAARVFSMAEDYFRAAENYLKAGDEMKTAQMLEKYFYQEWQHESPDLTATPSQRISNIAIKAGALFEKNSKWDKAMELYEKIQNKQKIANVLAQKGDFKKAAQVAEQTGEYKIAAEFHKKIGETTEVIRLEAEQLLNDGNLMAAAERFSQAKDYGRSADIYTDLQEISLAAQMYELNNDHYMAGKLYMQNKNYAKAGENFEKSNSLEEAIDAYREGKIEPKLLELYDKTGQYYEMAEYFFSRELYEQAIAAIEKIRSSDEAFRFGAFLRGKIAYEQANYPKAQEYFMESLRQVTTLSSKDLDTLHYLALVEQYQNAADFKSLDILDTKLAQNLVEKDSVRKANNIRKMIQDRSVLRVSDSRINSNRSFVRDMATTSQIQSMKLGNKRYEVIREIGRGGMGVVYLAKDTLLDREVALKILPASTKNNERIVQSFIREAKSAASLNHPNIVTVFDTGIQENDYYISMEYIDGQTIKRILKKKGKFSTQIVMELLKQLLGALDYAHKKNVIHRDLTTSNIMWTRQKLIKIMDFGLAKVISSLQNEQSIIGGTPSFMSPEQTLGHPIDQRTDIYSLGICIFEMCLGTLPFSKGDLGYHHLHTPPPVPKEIDPTIPQEINDVILKCMQKKMEDRYQSVQEIAKELSLT